MGKKIVLTGTTLTDLDAPMLTMIDPIESSGSMLLIDTMHPINPWAAGVPANSATIPNLLKGTLTTGDATFLTNGGLASTKGKLERSTLGGLHGIVSQAVNLASGDGARILFGTELRAYVYANLSHDYYISIWDRVTRANPNPSGIGILDYATTDYTPEGITHSGSLGWNSPGGSLLGSRTIPSAVGTRFANAAVPAAVMSASGSMDGAALPEWGAPAGSYGDAVFGSRNGYWPSFVFYRVYLEDLTVSGRSYATVDAIDYALYTQHVLTAGGRYYGDTMPTNPSTIP